MPFDVAMNAPSITRCLADLLDNLSDELGAVPVTGVTHDSRLVHPGTVFFALPGTVADGTKFAPQAVRHGASAVVAEAPLDLEVPVIVVNNARRTMAEAAARFFGHPDRAMNLVGIVGTNGKSTIAGGLQAVCTQAGIPSGVIGTIEYRWGRHSKPAPRTTPEATDLFDLLSQMRADGVRAAALEVSSHAIALDRVWGIQFKGGVFTNLTRDHLDFHRTMEEYRRVKGTFFERLGANDTFAAINIDDDAADYFLNAARHSRIIRYSATEPDADVSLDVVSHDLTGTRGSLRIAGQRYPRSRRRPMAWASRLLRSPQVCRSLAEFPVARNALRPVRRLMSSSIMPIRPMRWTWCCLPRGNWCGGVCWLCSDAAAIAIAASGRRWPAPSNAGPIRFT
jgi:UDP-N-acetylmuramyl tripeptide synthase